MGKRTIEFEFDINDKVDTLFAESCIVTMLGVEAENVISYYVENNRQGIVNKWFRASDLRLSK